MGTEVLRPQDPMSAIDRFHATPSFHRRRYLRSSPNLIVDRRPYNGQKKRDNRRRDGSRKTSSLSPPVHVNGHVTILRRGESLDSLAKGGRYNDNKNNRNGPNNRSSKSPNLNTFDDASVSGDHEDRQKSKSRGYKSCDDLAICGTRRIGPESPKMLPKHFELLPSRDVYAGSAFSLSPPPRSLPLPSFFGNNTSSNKKVGSCYDDDDVVFEDSATIGLRRLLRLDR